MTFFALVNVQHILQNELRCRESSLVACKESDIMSESPAVMEIRILVVKIMLNILYSNIGAHTDRFCNLTTRRWRKFFSCRRRCHMFALALLIVGVVLLVFSQTTEPARHKICSVEFRKAVLVAVKPVTEEIRKCWCASTNDGHVNLNERPYDSVCDRV